MVCTVVLRSCIFLVILDNYSIAGLIQLSTCEIHTFMRGRKQRKITRKAVAKVRYQVKQALVNNHSVKNYKPTVESIRSWFKTLNRGIFKGKLTEPTFRIKRLKGCYAQCLCTWDARSVKCPKNQLPVDQDHPSIEYIIEMKTVYSTWKDFIETLAHEMVHLNQMTVDKDVYSNHNKHFYKWRPTFKRFGLGLCL